MNTFSDTCCLLISVTENEIFLLTHDIYRQLGILNLHQKKEETKNETHIRKTTNTIFTYVCTMYGSWPEKWEWVSYFCSFERHFSSVLQLPFQRSCKLLFNGSKSKRKKKTLYAMEWNTKKKKKHIHSKLSNVDIFLSCFVPCDG